MRRILLGALGVALVVAAWEVSARAGWVNPRLLTPPSEVFPTMWDITRSGQIIPHVEMTLVRIGIGWSIGCLFGFALAILCYVWRPLREITAPVVEVVRAVPPLALLPAFLLLFGIGLRFPVAIVVWVTWVPVFLNTLDGLLSVPQELREAAWEYTHKMNVIRYVSIPVAAPHILIGLRLAMGSSFLVIVAAEMMGSTTGLGYYILDASSTFRIPEMYAGIVMLGLLAFAANTLLVAVSFLVWPHLRESSSASRSLAALFRRRAPAPVVDDPGTSHPSPHRTPSPSNSPGTAVASPTAR